MLGWTHLLPLLNQGPGINRSNGLFGLHAALLTPKSRGHLRLSSMDSKAPPDCDMQYLMSVDDYVTLRAALRMINEFIREMRAGGRG